MSTNMIKIKGLLHAVKHMTGVGYYVDIEGQAKTAQTEEELIRKLKACYGDGNVSVPKGAGSNGPA